MSTTQPTTKTWPSVTGRNVTRIFKARPSHSVRTVQFVQHKKLHALESIPTSIESPLKSRPLWNEREYREAYMEASVEQGVAWQIKINRQYRNMTQKDLASAIGTQQSAVSRLEDPEYGAYSMETLMDVAKAFDCALLVKFVSYSDLATDSENLSEEDQYAHPYSIEIEQHNV